MVSRKVTRREKGGGCSSAINLQKTHFCLPKFSVIGRYRRVALEKALMGRLRDSKMGGRAVIRKWGKVDSMWEE